MAQAVREVRRIRHSRVVSSQQVSMDNVHESMEKVSSGIKNLFAWKKSSYDKRLAASCGDADNFTANVVSRTASY